MAPRYRSPASAQSAARPDHEIDDHTTMDPRDGTGMFGYSSSSSEDEAQKKAAASNPNAKRIPRKKKPPQQSINKIWRRFQSKEFSRALSVLPFDPVPPPSGPDRPNEKLSVGYERAREECSRKVRKIIGECRRVNMRYRDPGFDLDFDLKWAKGNCLNYLGSNKFNLSAPRLSSSTAVPKAVKRVHEIFEKPTFMKNVSGTDIKQGALGNCWFIASLSSMANVEDGVRRCCVEYDTRIGIYGFVFYRDGEWIYSIVDDKLYLTSPAWDSPSLQRDLLNQLDRDEPEREYRKTYQTGSKALFFGQCKDQNETWLPLIEKAYAKAHGDYGSLSGGWIGEGIEDISGGVTTELLASDILDLDGFWENELMKVNKEFLFGCSTGLLDGGYGTRNGIREGHAYGVMDCKTLKNGQRLVKLRNPWGHNRKGLWQGAWSDGSKEWNSQEAKEELGHEFGNDSVFWITYEDMIDKYLHLDRTRLFRNDDWRCCQRWIGVEVPWKPQWNEKFHLRLTRESPLILVMQQLDNRYYKGLHGQYVFRLHFRLHHQDRPDAEDYIVRSHGNYLMGRSISVEIPCMEPGDYSVFLSVVAERDTSLPSVEDVVQRECKERVENEKLCQVGSAYDLAHSKGVAHLEQVAKLRTTTNAGKASNSRRGERRKLWTKRQTNREINRKQQEKNKAKRDRRVAEKEAQYQAELAEKKKTQEEQEKKQKQEEDEKTQKEKAEPETAEKKTQGEEVSDSTNNADEVSPEKPVDVAVQTDKKTEENANTKQDDDSSLTPEEKAKKDEESAKATENDAKAAEETAKVKAAEVAAAADTAARVEEERVAKQKAEDDARRRKFESECDSSDSPVSDWELMYSSDDMAKKPRIAAPAAASNDVVYESDGESKLPDPWNAVAIVGFRVYSHDDDMDLRVVMEGGELAEGGMGSKGQADLDNAQTNAGGARQEPTVEEGAEEVEIVNGEAVVMKKKVLEEKKGEHSSASSSDDTDEGEEADNESDDGTKTKSKKKKTKKSRKRREDKAADKIHQGEGGKVTGDNKAITGGGVDVTKDDGSSDSSDAPLATPDSNMEDDEPNGDCSPQSGGAKTSS